MCQLLLDDILDERIVSVASVLFRCISRFAQYIPEALLYEA